MANHSCVHRARPVLSSFRAAVPVSPHRGLVPAVPSGRVLMCDLLGCSPASAPWLSPCPPPDLFCLWQSDHLESCNLTLSSLYFQTLQCLPLTHRHPACPREAQIWTLPHLRPPTSLFEPMNRQSSAPGTVPAGPCSSQHAPFISSVAQLLALLLHSTCFFID